MKKKVYQKPLLMSEDFVPQEYVAACWTIACTQGTTGDQVNRSDNYDIQSGGKYYMDHSGSCSSAVNNVIANNNGVITVRENNSEQGWLDCTVVSPAGWADVTPGMEVTWTTTNKLGNKTWKHKGTAGALMPGHPNMS